MKKDLLQLADNGDISKTGAKPKLPTTIPNLTDNMLDVYRIPLNYLYYNDENGRVSTQVRRVVGELTPSTDDENPLYNEKFAGFIADDNLAALKKTKKSIIDKGQQVYGYVLSDGRIIDGNRRYTALRQISEETGTTQFFEAVILPFTYDAKANRSQIKRLELAIQLGVEEKLSYDPVDLAVDTYQTIVVDELMTAQDYANESNTRIKDVESKLATVELMQSFFEFNNMPADAFYIIKDLKLYSPLETLADKLNKQYPNRGPKFEATKDSAFTLLAKVIISGDDSRTEMRNYTRNIMSSAVNDDYKEQLEEVVDNFRDKMDSEPIATAAEYRARLETAVPELRQVNEKYATTTNRQNRGKNVDNFVGDVTETLNTLKDMQQGNGLTGNLQFTNFSRDQISEIRDMLVKINLISNDLIEVYEDEL